MPTTGKPADHGSPGSSRAFVGGVRGQERVSRFGGDRSFASVRASIGI